MLNFLSMLVPTQDQMTSYIRTAIKAAGGALASHGVAVSPELSAAVAGPEAIQVYTGIAMVIVPALFDRIIHSDAGKLKSASQLAEGSNPVIKTIETLPAAPAPIQALANDKSVPGVKAAISPPYTPPLPSQRK